MSQINLPSTKVGPFAFTSQFPPRITGFVERSDVPAKYTDYDFDTIPRAIENDFIKELLLKDEKRAGHPKARYANAWAYQPLRRKIFAMAHSIEPAPGLQMQTPTESPMDGPQESEDDGRTIILSDWGIDILNPTYQTPIQPLPKPKIACPSDKPIYSASKHKSPPSKYARTSRYGTWQNVASAVPVMVLQRVQAAGDEWRKRERQGIDNFVLRYTKDVPKKRRKVQRVIRPNEPLVHSPSRITNIQEPAVEEALKAEVPHVNSIQPIPSTSRTHARTPVHDSHRDSVGELAAGSPLTETTVKHEPVAPSPVAIIAQVEETAHEPRLDTWPQETIDTSPALEEQRHQHVDSPMSAPQEQDVELVIANEVEPPPAQLVESPVQLSLSVQVPTENHDASPPVDGPVKMKPARDFSPEPKKRGSRIFQSLRKESSVPKVSTDALEELDAVSQSIRSSPRRNDAIDRASSSTSLKDPSSPSVNVVPPGLNESTPLDTHGDDLEIHLTKASSPTGSVVSLATSIMSKKSRMSPGKSLGSLFRKSRDSLSENVKELERDEKKERKRKEKEEKEREKEKAKEAKAKRKEEAKAEAESSSPHKSHKSLLKFPHIGRRSSTALKSATDITQGHSEDHADHEAPESPMGTSSVSIHGGEHRSPLKHEPVQSPQKADHIAEVNATDLSPSVKTPSKVHLDNIPPTNGETHDTNDIIHDNKEGEQIPEVLKEGGELDTRSRSSMDNDHQQHASVHVDHSSDDLHEKPVPERQQSEEMNEVASVQDKSEVALHDEEEQQQRVQAEQERKERETQEAKIAAEIEKKRLADEALEAAAVIEKARIAQEILNAQIEADARKDAERLQRMKERALKAEAEKKRLEEEEVERRKKEEVAEAERKRAEDAAKVATEKKRKEEEAAKAEAEQKRLKDEHAKSEAEKRKKEEEAVKVEAERKRAAEEAAAAQETERQKREADAAVEAQKASVSTPVSAQPSTEDEAERRDRERDEERRRRKAKAAAQDSEDQHTAAVAAIPDPVQISVPPVTSPVKRLPNNASKFLNAMDMTNLKGGPTPKPPVHIEEVPVSPTEAEREAELEEAKAAAAPPQSAARKSVASLASVFGGGKSKMSLAGSVNASRATLSNAEKLKASATCGAVKVDMRLSEMELACTDASKGKPFKQFFPLELRRVVSCSVSDSDMTVLACTPRKGGKGGSKWKKMSFRFQDAVTANTWKKQILDLVYPDLTKLVEKYMQPVWEAQGRPCILNSVQFNEFSVGNVLSSLDFSKIKNILCVNNVDFAVRIQQLIVRNQLAKSPVLLSCETDPVDAALTVSRCESVFLLRLAGSLLI
ncbi:hypothetical protein DFS34DRAFT_39875 [Phlyctochytrium arcticum]|nr:hypothetical protein DFS34DRAFT_39875 [Phlyctochytrium arcticum]